MKKIHYKMQLVITLFLIGLSMPFVVQAESTELSSAGIEKNTALTEEEISSLRELLAELTAEDISRLRESLSFIADSNSMNENHKQVTLTDIFFSDAGYTEFSEEERFRLQELFGRFGINVLRRIITVGDEVLRFITDKNVIMGENSGSTVMMRAGCSPYPDLPLMRGDNTRLHNAAQWGHVDFAEELIDCGASLDIRNSKGWTPLHTASAWGHVNVAALLLNEGANPYMTTGFFKRETPRDLAANNPNMLKLFDDYEVRDISYCKYFLAACPHRLFY